MRSAVVLVLVLLGVAALYFALAPSSSSDEEAGIGAIPGAAAAVPGGEPAAIDPTPIASTPTPATANRVASEPAEVRPTRVTVEGQGSFDTGLGGVVTDPDGVPVESAMVTLRDDAGLGAGGALAPFLELAGAPVDQGNIWSATTDDQGRYSLSGMEPGDKYTLVVAHENFAPKELTMIEVLAEERRSYDVQLDAGYTVQGYVFDHSTATPLLEAELTLVPLMFAQLPPGDPKLEAQTRRATSDSYGQYRIHNVSPGMRQLTCTAEGFGTVTIGNLSVAGDIKMVNQDFRLEPGTLVAGQVLQRDGSPVEGARVQALSYGGQKSSRGEAQSGADGRFEIRDLLEGTYSVFATAEGWDTARVNRVEAGDTSVRLEMARLGGITGTVLADGRPISDFTVALRMMNPHNSQPGRPMQNRQFEDARDGAFALAGVADGRYVVEARAPGYAPTFSEQFDVTRGEQTAGIEVQLNRGGAITGRIVESSSGDPVAGAKVTTFDNTYMRNPLSDVFDALMPRATTEASARTDRDGYFELTLLSPDVYQLMIEHNAFTTQSLKDVRVTQTEEPTDIGAIRLREGATLTGTVYDGSGVQLAGATVTVSGNMEAPGVSYTARTTSSGTYAIRNIQPGRYNVHAQRPTQTGGSPFDGIVDMNRSRVDVSLVEGRTTTQDLFLGN